MNEPDSLRSPDEIVSRMMRAIENRDFDTAASAFADDFRIWHSYTNKFQDKETALAGIRSTAGFKHYAYECIDKKVIGERLMQRVNISVITNGGNEVVIPVAVFITTGGGKIKEIYEYMDPSPLADAIARDALLD